ncbi:hypothetical protein V4V35_25505 [Bacillus infantis]|uniref:hypothetical protein n=1 Tax=Bacillus infantis TaxID=324767 RepID=UPI002FBF148C
MEHFKSELGYIKQGFKVIFSFLLFCAAITLVCWLAVKYIVIGWIVAIAVMLFMLVSIAYMIGKTMEW